MELQHVPFRPALVDLAVPELQSQGLRSMPQESQGLKSEYASATSCAMCADSECSCRVVSLDFDLSVLVFWRGYGYSAALCSVSEELGRKRHW